MAKAIIVKVYRSYEMKHAKIYLIYIHFPSNSKTVSKLEESKWINLNFCVLNDSL